MFLKFLESPFIVPARRSGTGTVTPPDTSWPITQFGSELVLWLKAAPADVTLVSGEVTTWRDRSSHSFLGAPNSPYDQPNWDPDDPDWEHPSVKFSRVDNTAISFDPAAAEITGAWTITTAFKFSELSPAPGAESSLHRRYLWRMGTSNYVGLLLTTANELALICEDTRGNFHEIRHADWDTDEHIITAVITPAVYSGSTMVTPGSAKLYDGTDELPLSPTTFNYQGAFNQLLFGSYAFFQHQMSGSMTECMIVNRALSPSEIASVVSFISSDKVFSAGGGGGGGGDIGTPINTATWMASGHSLLNDPMFSMTLGVANALGKTANYQYQMRIGSTIKFRNAGSVIDPYGETHNGWYEGENRGGGEGLNIISELRNPTTVPGSYNHLIICERHDSLGSLRYEDGLLALKNYHDTFIAAVPSGKTYFYGTWQYVNYRNTAQVAIPWSLATVNNWRDFTRLQSNCWETLVSRMNDVFQAAGRTDRMCFLPADAALADLVDRAVNGTVAGITQSNFLDTMNLIFDPEPEMVHLNAIGHYFIACVIYSSVYRQSPVGSSFLPSGVNSTQAASLQTIAWNFVSAYYAGRPLGRYWTQSERMAFAQTFAAPYHNYLGSPGSAGSDQTYFASTSASNPFYSGIPSAGWWPLVP